MSRLNGVGFLKGLPKADRLKRIAHWKKFKSWRQGFKAAKVGESTTDCPYQLTEDMVQLLLKRDRWLRGYEEAAFRPPGKRPKTKFEKELKRQKKRR